MNERFNTIWQLKLQKLGEIMKNSSIADRLFYIVGIGASAGGLEALDNFFSTLPNDTGMAFVIIQHLSPDYKSLMVEILSKRTAMKVHRAENGMIIEPNNVYLITPKKNLTIFHGKLLLHEQDPSKGLNLPIDIFFKSLAEDLSERAIGIILSGTGSDGMRGVRSIKECGGYVLVQDEETAKFDGMPRSAISTGLADFILPPDQMPPQLIKFVKHPINKSINYPEKLLTDEDSLTRTFSLLRDKHKVDFTFYKMSTIVRRIHRRMTVNNISKLNDYVRYLENYTREVTSLYKELLIGVTNFYRDKEAFQLLDTKFLRELLKRNNGRHLRFWVVGCSTGEEAYSIATLTKECIDQEKLKVDVKIFATDVDEEAILKSGNGIYPESITADLSPYLVSKYFFRKDDHYQIVRSIREMVVFAQHNVLKDPPFTNIDFISCRNLLIYLQPVLQQKVLEFFNFSLNPQGLLFLGSSESIGEMVDFFTPLNHKWKIYLSRGRKKHPKVLSSTDLQPKNRALRNTNVNSRYRDHFKLEKVLERFLQSVHDEIVPLTIIVNEENELIHTIGDISPYFKFPSGRVTIDVTKMAHKELSILLSTGLQKLFYTKEDITYSNVILRINEKRIILNISMKYLHEKRGQEPLAAILITELKQQVEKSISSQKFDIAEETEQRLYDLEQELQFTRENLQATIEELETSNEELQATNEELLASNEELQSTNEELQSVNEELHTVNAEYQTKIIELTELNNDMDNLLASTEIGTLFLDENLEIRKFTPQVKEIININEKDLDRPLTDLSDNITSISLIREVEEVQKTARKVEKEISITNGDHFLMRILPYYIAPKEISGIVITFINITRLHKTQQQLKISSEQHQIATSLTSIGYWEINLATMATKWTEEVYHIHELEPQTLHDVNYGLTFYHPDDQEIIKKAVEKCISYGEDFDLKLRFITAKKNLKWVRAIGKADVKSNKVVRVYGAFQDITNFVEIKEDLQESKAKYKELFDTIKSGVIIYRVENKGEDFYIKDMNGAAEKITKLSKKLCIGKSIDKLFPGIVEMGLKKVLNQVWVTGEAASLDKSFYEDKRISKWLKNSVYKLPSGDVVAVFDEIPAGKDGENGK